MNEKSEVEMESSEKQKDSEDLKQANGRHRTKHIYNAIRQQMEFYFGDANLSKDRFMKQLIKDDEYVPIEVFLKFNKIKSLTTSAEKIVKALAKSTLLEVSKDQTKVRRMTEIPKERNVDDRSIYVECLPRYADHEWVKNVFSRYGPIEYISIPRYKHSRKIKEFAFVEFEQSESVQKTLNSFTAFNGVMSPSSVEPGKLTSVVSYIKEQTEDTQDQAIAMEAQDDDTKKGKRKLSDEFSESEKSLPAAKQSRTDKKEALSASDSEDLRPQTKRARRNEDSIQSSEADETCKKEEIVEEIVPPNNKSEDVEKTGTDNDEDKSETNDEDSAVKKKKRRRRIKKSTNRIQDFDNDVIELKILPKKEWKRLRNTYLNLQRTKVAEAKRHLHNLSNKTPKSKETSKYPIKNSRNMNFYGANPESAEEDTDKAKQKAENVELTSTLRPPLFQFEPGIIVQFKFPSPCVDIKDFKAEMKQYSHVKYVDVKEGALEAFVRCDDSNSASLLVKQSSCPTHTAQVISGDVETAYWQKIMKDREEKLNKKCKINTIRGREKIVKAIAKHTRFDEDE